MPMGKNGDKYEAHPRRLIAKRESTRVGSTKQVAYLTVKVGSRKRQEAPNAETREVD